MMETFKGSQIHGATRRIFLSSLTLVVVRKLYESRQRNGAEEFHSVERVSLPALLFHPIHGKLFLEILKTALGAFHSEVVIEARPGSSKSLPTPGEEQFSGTISQATFLYNYRARYFDPSQGRFLQTDPLGYQDSMNLYQGMNMNPVNFVDPWGMLKFSSVLKGAWQFTKTVAVGTAIVSGTAAISVVSAPVAVAVGAGTLVVMGGKAVANRIADAQSPTQVTAGTVADLTGATGVWAGATNKDIVTGENLNLNEEQRAEAIGGGLGQAATLVIAPKVFKESYARSRPVVWNLKGTFNTNINEAFFWSGKTKGVGGPEVASKIASSRGGTTLEQVIEARNIKLPKWDPNNPASVKAFRDASEAYAKGAKGTVHAVVGESLRPGNVWKTVELPALIANQNVTQIIQIDPLTGVETVIFTR